MFEKGFYTETQVLAYVYSYDGLHSPDVLAICAASAALVLSDIPLINPIGAVRVGMLDDRFVINPTSEEMKSSKLDLVLAGTEDAILMIEGYCDFLTEEQILEAIEIGHKAIQRNLRPAERLARKDRTSQKSFKPPAHPSRSRRCSSAILLCKTRNRAPHCSEIRERSAKSAQSKQALTEELLSETNPKFAKPDVLLSFKTLQSDLMRKMILNEKKRIDGRALTRSDLSTSSSLSCRGHMAAHYSHAAKRRRSQSVRWVERTMRSDTKIYMARDYTDFTYSTFSHPFRSAKLDAWARPVDAKLATANSRRDRSLQSCRNRKNFPM